MTVVPADAGKTIDRIVVIHDFAAPEGGAGVMATLTARECVRRGIPVTYFAGAKAGGKQALPGVELIGRNSARLLDLSPLEATVQGLHNSAASNCLREWIAANDTDRTIYHLHNWSQILSPAIFEGLRGVEQRLVVTCHDFFNVCPNGSFTNFSASRPCELRPLSLGCLASQCDRRSSVHKYWRSLRQVHLNRLIGLARSKATFTFLHDRMKAKFAGSGFAAERMVTLANPVEAWSPERIPAESNREFLFVGRIGRDKGADLAAVAAAQAGVSLTLVGEGELMESLRGSAANLQLAGWCDRAGILEHARRARALVVPSRVVEPFGLVILEAAMSGLPVVVSDRAYLSGDIERLGFGFAFDPSSPGRLGELMSSLASDDEQVAQMSHIAIARSGQLALSVPEWSERLISLFRAILPA